MGMTVTVMDTLPTWTRVREDLNGQVCVEPRTMFEIHGKRKRVDVTRLPDSVPVQSDCPTTSSEG